MASILRHVWWINLGRRHDRREEAEAALCEAGLWDLSERVEGRDGRSLDLNSIDPAIAAPEAVAQARQPPKHVVDNS